MRLHPKIKEGTLFKLTRDSMGVPKTDRILMSVTDYGELDQPEVQVAYLVKFDDIHNAFCTRYVGSGVYFYVEKKDIELL